MLLSVTVSDLPCRTQRLVLPDGVATWTVLNADHQVIGAAEEFLEYLRVQGTSPNTVKSYARALALWWSYLCTFGLGWDRVSLAQVGGFLAWLRSGDGPGVTSIVVRPSRFAESTIATRLRAVTSCYRFHELNGVRLGGDLARLVHGARAAYLPMLEHVARRQGRRQAVVRVRQPGRAAPPVLTPGQIAAVCGACARADTVTGEWAGRVRDRLLWELLAETGLRLGEALSLQHRDWHTGRGDTPFIEVVPRDLPHGVRVKGSRYRRVFISDDLDRLYGEYLWQLCDAGADLAVPDLDQAQVFVNLDPPRRVWRPLCLRTAYYLSRFKCLIVEFLELFRRDIAAVRVKPLLIIPGHPVHRGKHHITDTLPSFLEIDKLSFVEAVQRFRRGVIIRITLTTDRADRIRFLQPFRITDRGILDATIGMMDQPAQVVMTAYPDRHFKRIDGKIRTQVIGNLPADNPTRMQIHDERRVHPAGQRHYVCDIRHPAPVRRRRGEASIQQVRRPRRRVSRHSRPRPLPPGLHAADPQLAHQPLDRAPRHLSSLLIQCQPDFPRAVHLPAILPVFPHLHDLLLQDRISGFPRRRLSLALLRVVIRRNWKLQDRADRLDAKPVPVRVNELD